MYFSRFYADIQKNINSTCLLRNLQYMYLCCSQIHLAFWYKEQKKIQDGLIINIQGSLYSKSGVKIFFNNLYHLNKIFFGGEFYIGPYSVENWSGSKPRKFLVAFICILICIIVVIITVFYQYDFLSFPLILVTLDQSKI